MRNAGSDLDSLVIECVFRTMFYRRFKLTFLTRLHPDPCCPMPSKQQGISESLQARYTQSNEGEKTGDRQVATASTLDHLKGSCDFERHSDTTVQLCFSSTILHAFSIVIQ
jgi:hypothetical protein